MDISFTKLLPEQALMDQDIDYSTFNIHQRSSQIHDHSDFNFQPPNNITSKSNNLPPLSHNYYYYLPQDCSNFSQPISFEESNNNNSLQMLNDIQNLKHCNMMKQQQQQQKQELCHDDPDQNLNDIMAMEILRLHHHQRQEPAGHDNIMRMAPIRSPLQAREHVLAERKRREKLNQQFIALSAIIPGVKKMNKDSILEGTIKYLKELQEKEKKLGELTKKKPHHQLILGVNKQSDHHHDDVPQIVARVSEKNVLLRIHCEKHINGCLAKILNEIENLHLMVINSRTIPFGDYALDITIVAQMEVEFSMSMKQVVQKLSEFLCQG